MPLGNPLQLKGTWVAIGYLPALVPVIALVAAGPITLRRDTRDLDDTKRMTTGAAIGFYAGATTAILLATFTILTMSFSHGWLEVERRQAGVMLRQRRLEPLWMGKDYW